MTDREKINRALSGLKASEDTLREVIKMAEKKTHRNTGKKIVTIALAACLVLALSITVCAATGIIDVGGEMGKNEFFHNALGTGIEGRDEFTIDIGEYIDRDGNPARKIEEYPAVERVDVDFELAEELLGDYVVAINKGYTTKDGDEIILRDFVMDENGIGMLSFEVRGDNAKEPFSFIRIEHNGEIMDDSALLVSEGENSCVMVAYITPMREFDGKNISVVFCGHSDFKERYSYNLEVDRFVPSQYFDVNGVTAKVSPLGMLIKSQTGSVDSWTGGETINFKDGSQYVLISQNVINTPVSSLLNNGDEAFAFNRLVDVDNIDSVSFRVR